MYDHAGRVALCDLSTVNDTRSPVDNPLNAFAIAPARRKRAHNP